MTHREEDRWADFEIEGQEGMYFGLINSNALENKRVIGNNATLGIYTDDITKAFDDILFLVTDNKNHPAYKLIDKFNNLKILYYED